MNENDIAASSEVPEALLGFIEDTEVQGIEVVKGDEKFFVDVSSIKRNALGRLTGRVTVVDQWAMDYAEDNEVELPEEIRFRKGDILVAPEDFELPEGSRALKIAGIAGLVGGAVITGVGLAHLVGKKLRS